MTTPETVQGQICAFYAQKGSVVQCLPVVGAVQHVGQVLEAKWSTQKGREGCPYLLVKVRGRSGKTAVVDCWDQYARFFPTWEQAIASTQP